MNVQTSLVFVKKLNDLCGLDNSNLIYTMVPLIDSKPGHMEGIYSHTLDKLPLVIDSSLGVFAGVKGDFAKSSYAYLRIKEEKEDFIKKLTDSSQLLRLGSISFGDSRCDAAFAALSQIYLSSFIVPVQFFLPHSSVCSGQWGFWDKIDYMELVEKANKKDKVRLLCDRLNKSDVWKTKFEADDFPEIVKRRLVKEKKLDKKLDPNALMKAMIIRMGELASPSINYEVIDFSIRSFFTYLGVKQYLRVDREMLFLRRFEEEMKKVLVGV